MATFILLHGSFHAAWNWHKLIPLLQAAGHNGLALDLPGHGHQRMPARKVTLDRCVEEVLRCVDALPAQERVVLVAHSRNGIVISQAAERLPDRIAGLVYLAAYLVPDGRSMMDYALTDTESLVVQNLEVALAPKYFPFLTRLFRSKPLRLLCSLLLPEAFQIHRLRRSAYFEALYHDCPSEITRLAEALLEAEANWPGFAPLRLQRERFGSVPKIYVECLQDRAVTLPLQRRMLGETPCDQVFSLDTSHSPFFSQPGLLLDVLIKSLHVFETKGLIAGKGQRP